MTNAANATFTATRIRLKNARPSKSSPTTTSASISSSNNIASSTSFKQAVITPPPRRNSLSSNASTCSMLSNSSSISNVSSSSGNYYATRQQRQQPLQSPKFFFGSSATVGGSFSSSKTRYSPKNREVRNTPTSSKIIARQLSIIATTNVSDSWRKNRAKLPTNSSPLSAAFGIAGGKITPIQAQVPTALTHFATSKCFHAPSPVTLPKPPEHWTSLSTLSTSTIRTPITIVATSSLPATKPYILKRAVSNISCGQAMKSSKRYMLDSKIQLNVQS